MKQPYIIAIVLFFISPSLQAQYSSCDSCRKDHRHICIDDCNMERFPGKGEECFFGCYKEKCKEPCRCLYCRSDKREACRAQCAKRSGNKGKAPDKQCELDCMNKDCAKECKEELELQKNAQPHKKKNKPAPSPSPTPTPAVKKEA